ncbi:alpha/beta hydrolase [Mariniflexile sp.]|uniref:alpha/beta hydrolase n=1 Tax=Mariniflexile sp. TaxID=1979402 RepID=UPI00404746B4
MKKTVLLILFISSISISSQTIFDYEREITQKENYNFQEIEFENSDENFKLSGTLITPKSDFDKLIIIIPGSGKDTRYSHSKLTEILLRNNIAVYRFDERGTGKSEGDYSQKVSPLKDDLYFCLKHMISIDELKNKKIGVLGHSLGGMASIGVFENKQPIDFLIQMSTPVNAGEDFKNRVSEVETFKNRKKSIKETQKIIDTFNIIIHSVDGYENIIRECEKARKKLKFPDYISKAYLTPNMIDFVKLDTESYYKNIHIPLLYIIGANDEQIDVKNGISKLKKFDNEFINIEVIDKLDHYLTLNNGKWNKSKQSLLREIDDFAAKKIIDWINKLE